MTPIAIILSIILCLLGIISSYYIARWQMKKNKIVHYTINSYDIGKGLSDKFPNFKLLFDGNVLSDNVMVLKGGFMNTGMKDIGENGKKTILKFCLPEGCIVKDVHVDSLVKGLIVNKFDIEEGKKEKEILLGIDGSLENKNDNDILLEIVGLLKTNECFEYTAIIEAPDDISYFDNIQFNNRIKDTYDIRSFYIGEDYSYSTVLGRNFYIRFLLFVVIFIVIAIISIDKERLINTSYIFLLILGFVLPLMYVIITAIINIFGQRNHVIHVLNKIKNKK